MDVKERRSAKSMGHRKFLSLSLLKMRGFYYLGLEPFQVLTIISPPSLKLRRAFFYAEHKKMVGQGRLELPTSRLSVVRSNQLSYKPVFL